ncbi:thrombospondin type 3 repeat-containing protein [Alcanivorax jadensis]|uniref:thrombospondin type 3 repeat-containing protein n=1 Tax=Alcanivorax jadensis TaxID=64988 RepID=UPI000A83C43E|nr:thrombospondin type 3 repeat-containing protein [Alcanivorax jadensis]
MKLYPSAIAILVALLVFPLVSYATTVPGETAGRGQNGGQNYPPCEPIADPLLPNIYYGATAPYCINYSINSNNRMTRKVIHYCTTETHPLVISVTQTSPTGDFDVVCGEPTPECPEDDPHLEYGCDGGLITGLEGSTPICSFSIPDSLCRDECEYDRPGHVIGGTHIYPGSDFATNSRWVYYSTGASCAADTVLDGEPIEEDADSDGVPDAQDNCPSEPNPDQLDTDSDGQGDACQQGTGEGDGSGDETGGEGDGSGDDGTDEGDGTGQGTDPGDGTSDNGDGTGDDETDGGSTGSGDGTGDGDDTGGDGAASLGSCNPDAGDICGDSIWDPRYPDGLLGVWNSHQAAIDQSALVTWLRSWSLPDSGSCPQVSMSFNLGSLGSFGSGSLPGTDFCWIWSVLAAIINFCALLLARALIFGG